MAEKNAKLKAGDKMADGTIFAGISPDTNKAMYVTAEDASLTMTFNAAKEYASKLETHGHKDWRMPTIGELHVLFQNKNRGALKGTFNNVLSYFYDFYWSSSRVDADYAWGQRFKDSFAGHNARYVRHNSSVRCVRG